MQRMWQTKVLLLSFMLLHASILIGELAPVPEPISPDFSELRRDAGILWRTVNDASLEGQRFDPEITGLLERILSEQGRPNGEQLERFRFALEHARNEIDAAGRSKDGDVFTDTPGPFVAGGRSRFVQKYRLLASTLGPGSAVLVAQQWLNYQPFQADDPALDNFITIRANRSDVRFQSRFLYRGGLHGGFNRAVPVLMFELIEGELGDGDLLEIDYGGAKGIGVPRMTMDDYRLPLYLRDGPDSAFKYVDTPGYVIEGGAPVQLSGTAPSVLRMGERFDLRIQLLDRFGNLARGTGGSIELLINGIFASRIEETRDGLGVARGLHFELPGIYRMQLRSSGGGLQGRVNPIRVSRDENVIRWGELRGETSFGTASESMSYLLMRARDQLNYDFLGVSDQDLWLQDGDWQRIQEVTAEFTDKDFTVLPGFRRTAPLSRGGQLNLLFRRNGQQRLAQHEAVGLTHFYHLLRSRYNTNDVMVMPITSAATDPRYADPALTSLVEVVSNDGWFETLADSYLRRGFRVGFNASGKIQQFAGEASRTGMTGVYLAPGQSVFDGLKSGRTVATTGERMILDFTVNGAVPGERAPRSSRRQLRGDIVAPDAIEWVEVIRNGQSIYRESFVPEEVTGDMHVKLSLASAPDFERPATAFPWTGFVSVNRERFSELSPLGFADHLGSRVKINPQDPARIDFLTQTLGDSRGFGMSVDDWDDDLVFDISLKQPEQDAGASTPLKLRQRISILELMVGPEVRSIGEGSNSVSLTLSRVAAELPREFSFEIEDESTSDDDYYYLRVKQLNDHMGWTSPIRVGGIDLR